MEVLSRRLESGPFAIRGGGGACMESGALVSGEWGDFWGILGQDPSVFQLPPGTC